MRAFRLVCRVITRAEELALPFYYEVSSLCHNLHVTSPKTIAVRSALINGGYKVSQTHCSPQGVRPTGRPSHLLSGLRTRSKPLFWFAQ